jgi:hypothetical protein
MEDAANDPRPVKNRGLVQVGVVLGVIALYVVGSWAKTRFIDPDRLLLGVHALGSEEALVMFRDDTGEDLPWRIEKIRRGNDEPSWGHGLHRPLSSHVGNGMSVAGEDVVVLDSDVSQRVSVTALDLTSGDVTWKRKLVVSNRRSPTIVGRDKYVLIDGADRLHILDRATGNTIYEREGHTQNLDYAFTETWIELLEPMAVDYLEIESGQRYHLENTSGAFCRIGEHAYGFDQKHVLRSHHLASGKSLAVIPQQTPLPKVHAWACGWQNNPDGSLRLVFTHQNPGLLIAIDLDPASPSESGRVAWTRTFAADIQPGDISYRVPNRLDLVWSGKVPRFAPLEIRTAGVSGDLGSQIVVVDTREGTLARQGLPGEHIAGRFTSFKRGNTVFMAIEGRPGESPPGTVLAMDARTGVTHAVSSVGEFRTVSPSVTDDVVWAWIDRSFSRADNLAITVLDHELQMLDTHDPSRAPTADEDAVTSLLGAEPR